jgi:hypothetical protein
MTGTIHQPPIHVPAAIASVNPINCMIHRMGQRSG